MDTERESSRIGISTWSLPGYEVRPLLLGPGHEPGESIRALTTHCPFRRFGADAPTRLTLIPHIIEIHLLP
jgi:hypothetical protein